jgi:hypothetical protein
MRDLRCLVGTFLVSIAPGCAREHVVPAPSPEKLTPSPIVETEHFALPLPEGYADATSELRKDAPQLSMVLRAKTPSNGYRPTIVVRKVPIPGGSFADPSLCTQTGRGIVNGGTDAPGTGGTLLSASIVEGPLGKTCQIHLSAPDGIALITELPRPGNTPLTPQDMWLMICNHADGDANAEAACRSALARFRFRDR